MKLWRVDSDTGTSPEADLLNNSLPVDQRLNRMDVIGSMAWTKNLARFGLLTPVEAEKIQAGLQQIDL